MNAHRLWENIQRASAFVSALTASRPAERCECVLGMVRERCVWYVLHL